MKIPLSWLRDYVDVEIPVKELAHRLTMAGVEVGEVDRIGDWNECFVGQITSVRPHPQADRLTLCGVDTGSGEVEVVCGAPNVAAKQKICFANPGANLIDAHTGKREPLKPARIRGVVSEGMICSELELGLGEDHTGIIILPDDAPLGAPLDGYLGDTILDLEVTPNRLDCLSILGVAHEVAALTGATVREPEISYPEEGPSVSEEVNISIADPDLCYRYTASLIKGVSVGPSPVWLQERLTKAGLRPINNVVDVTNYVMLEYNQPLHAFDYDRLKDRTIIVRRAKAGETLETLDGAERKLNSQVLVIADGHDPIGIGGVIGGANSEINADTVNVLLESANFDGLNNRQTAQNFRLHTDATLRFEKGLRPELAPIALRRATQLIQQVTGGSVAPGIIDVFPESQSLTNTVGLSSSRLKRVLGMDVDLDTVERVLGSLGFEIQRQGHARVEASVPYWRNDVNIEDDLVEEVVRILGYDSVPVTMLSTPIPYRSPDRRRSLVELVKDILAASGMQEVISYPLISSEDLEKTNSGDKDNPRIKIANPLNSVEDCLRPSLRPSLLRSLASNQGHSEGPFRLFEVGSVFQPRPDELPHEQLMVCGILVGRRWETSWLEDSGSLDFYDAKGVVEGLLQRLGVAAEYQIGEDTFFRAGRCGTVVADGVELGVLGEVHSVVAENFDIRAESVAFFELQIDALLEALPETGRAFARLARFPAATRDLALVVPTDVSAGRVHDIIDRHRLVDHAELFDIYAGGNVPPGTKSLAFHVYFQAQDRTLTTEEVNRSLQGLLRTLEREAQASLRA